MGDYVCKFNALELHSTGEETKKFKPVRIGTGYRLMNDEGQVLVGSNGNEYDFATEGRAENFLMTNLARVKNMTGNVSVDYIQGLIKNYAENQFYWVLDEIESIRRLNNGVWKAVLTYGDCDHGPDNNTADIVPDYVYERPAQWLPLPEIAEGEEKIVMLVAVKQHHTLLNLLRIDDDYIVDWGDGSVENLNSASGMASHEYDYNNPALGNEIAELGYKQVIVTITPQAGNHLTRFSLGSTSSSHKYVNPLVLDLHIQAPELSTFSAGGTHLACNALENIKIGPNKVSSWYQDLMHMHALKNIDIDFSNATSLSSTFEGCDALRGVGEINAPLLVHATSMFRNCFALSKIKVFNAPKVQRWDRAFEGTEIVAVNSDERKVILNVDVTPSSMYGAFINTKIENLIINNPPAQGLTDMSLMFYGIDNLKTVSIANALKPSSMASTFRFYNSSADMDAFNIDASECDRFDSVCSDSNVKNLPTWFHTNGSNYERSFIASALENLPNINFTGVNVKLNYFALSTPNLLEIGSIDFVNGANTTTNIINSTSRQLSSIGAIDYSKMPNTTSFSGCYSLSNVDLFNIDKSINFTNCNLSASEINKIFNNLLTATGKTITVTGCPGASDCDVSIATAKGWAVVD